MLKTNSTKIMFNQEAQAMLSRLAQLKPFALLMPAVHAAAIPQAAQGAIEVFLAKGRNELRKTVKKFLKWLHGPDGRVAKPSKQQRQFTLLRLKYNALLTHYDIFADVLTQRSEHGYGVWVAGMDVAAADALTLSGNYYYTPPVITYLDRGMGAAIRRVRTRLPGGNKNPVAIIRVPRERMVGSGIASSLVHEVGHQGSVLLDLINSMSSTINRVKEESGAEKIAWQLWERWISEILADFWSVAKVGITSTLGLIQVLSLPKPFVFRVNPDDPHPSPWIRVKLSIAMGNALYPHQQWNKLSNLWESLYPVKDQDKQKLRLFSMLEATMPRFVTMLINHRPMSLRGNSLKEVMPIKERQPVQLDALWRSWRKSFSRMTNVTPTLAFAVIGQARANGDISTELESRILTNLLKHWALKRSLGTDKACMCKEVDNRHCHII